jgi:hypothetical protein
VHVKPHYDIQHPARSVHRLSSFGRCNTSGPEAWQVASGDRRWDTRARLDRNHGSMGAIAVRPTAKTNLSQLAHSNRARFWMETHVESP